MRAKLSYFKTTRGAYLESPDEKIERISVLLEPVHYRDRLHNPNARHQGEIDWISYKTLHTKTDVREKFGDAIAEKLTYGTQEKGDKPTKDEKTIATQFATFWEIWNLRKREVYWHAEGYDDELVKPLEYEDGDPYELAKFFPEPALMLGTVGPDDMFPIPDFMQIRPLILQLHGLYERLRKLVRASRRRGIYSGDVPELDALNDLLDEADYISVTNFKELIGDGGLDNIVKLFPVKEFADAIRETVAVSELLEAKIDMIWGTPDILKGTTDPNETASAQQQKGKYLSLRASTAMGAFQRLVADSIEIMCDLALHKFPEDKLIEVMGVAHWTPEDQQVWPQVLALIQDDEERKVRIDIETDSTVTMNENAEVEQRNYLAQIISQVVDSFANVSQNAPELKPVVMKTMQLLVRGVRAGKHVEAELDKAIEAAMQPQPEKPDPEAMKAQAAAQAQQAEAQLKAQMQQAELQFKQMELETNTRLKLKQMELETQKLQLEMQQLAAQNEVNAYKVQSEAMTAAFDKKLDAIRIEIEKQYVSMDMQEKFMEEQRLRQDQNTKSSENEARSKSSAQPIQINVDARQPVKKVSKIIRDGMGSISHVEHQDAGE